MPLNAEQLAELRAVNGEINALPYVEAQGAHEPADWWGDQPVPGQSWVCRDYVLAKADRLRDAGWPGTSLTVVLCWTEPVGNPPIREYHAVLAVDAGDADPWILDSRQDDIYRMSAPPADYEWDRRQIAGTTDFESVA